ncbi:carboxypeptidase-like regulatory domain-containing protein [Lunatibacter salilacus]|uniref:carboxypeptidase-like regulatory domain-containing protein n=1 Tax=Lunatibacter salilacus TaxID=2483804 RepID=UPI00131A621B|nr:carboxypeptidase-like regulatory domain-containing protein [Lunatibacter salilacus]
MKLIQYLFVLLCLGLAVGCKSPKEKTQGIHGQLFWVEGNLMPQATEDGSGPTEQNPRQGVQRTVKIHSLTHIDQLSIGDYLIGTIQTPEIASFETDPDGSFRIELPIGKYSLFTVEQDGFFANIFDSENHINPVEVKAGEWSRFDIIINYKAVY